MNENKNFQKTVEYVNPSLSSKDQIIKLNVPFDVKTVVRVQTLESGRREERLKTNF